MKEMLQAISDWVGGRFSSLEKRLDIETILRKTGNASKAINVFSNYSSRTLPASGETLDITLGKIRKYLYDLKTVAFSGSFKDLSYRSLVLEKVYYNYSATAAFTEEISEVGASDALGAMWLIVGTGGSESTAAVSGATDFARAYLVVPKWRASNAAYGQSLILLQLGSSGSTARYTLTAVAATASSDEKLTLTIPKGSYAHVAVYELRMNSNYVG